MAVKKGLGRGFDSLIPTELLDESFDPTAEQDEKMSDLRQIRLSEIIPDPDQPRQNFNDEALAELAASVKQHGILQPIVVTPKNGKYLIVAGERRYRASQLAGLTKIPALVRTLSAQHRLELSLIENLQRADLNPIETATAFLKLRDQFSLSLEEIMQRVGRNSASAVSNTLRLLRLPKFVQDAVAQGDLTEGQARPLIGIDAAVLEELLPRIIAEGWSARKIENAVVGLRKAAATTQQAKVIAAADAPYRSEAEQLQKRLGNTVAVTSNNKGAGRIVIKFKNDDEFQKLYKRLS
jgi:ParB family transcriptional regulator, chromosome partitioning protein